MSLRYVSGLVWKYRWFLVMWLLLVALLEGVPELVRWAV